MARKDIFAWLVWLITLLVALAVGGLFVSGATASFVILSWIPLTIHLIVGWVIIIGAIINAIMSATKK